MIVRLDSYLQTQQAALQLRAKRQEVLAANIANADTPGYKARDFEFKAAFQNALSNPTSGDMRTSHSRHMQAQGSQDIFGAPMLYRGEQQSSIDGNTVNMDTEMSEFTDNALRYQAALTFMQKRIELMRNAIQG